MLDYFLDEDDRLLLNRQELRVLNAKPCMKVISGNPKMSGTTRFHSNHTGTADKIAVTTPSNTRARVSIITFMQTLPLEFQAPTLWLRVSQILQRLFQLGSVLDLFKGQYGN
jgi:hypothetical protein